MERNIDVLDGISIHAPRAGSDGRICTTRFCRDNFNPRSPCGERRAAKKRPYAPADFNPRSPCGERPQVRPQYAVQYHFNPRSPCGERRPPLRPSGSITLFQSTLPVRGATFAGRHVEFCQGISIHAPRAGSDGRERQRRSIGLISIHAPRAGSDTCCPRYPATHQYFNPRSPCGERQQTQRQDKRICYFNPRSPCGERRAGVSRLV